MRSVIECLDDALFLMEGNPETKANVEKFVDHFAQTTIENAQVSTYQPVKREKIQNVAACVFPTLLSGTFGAFGELEKHLKTLRERIWNAWCNSVHSNYSEIMQMYGPRGPRARFQLRGIPREHVRAVVWAYIEEIKIEAALTLWAVAMKLGLGGLADEIGRRSRRHPGGISVADRRWPLSLGSICRLPCARSRASNPKAPRFDGSMIR